MTLHTELTQSQIEEQEFAELVRRMSPLGFTESREVSFYIRCHRLGRDYPHLSGQLRMYSASQGVSWDFEGGINPKWYARLCEALGLGHRGSDARVEKFTSYAQLALI